LKEALAEREAQLEALRKNEEELRRLKQRLGEADSEMVL
jgi:hypothetical protein